MPCIWTYDGIPTHELSTLSEFALMHTPLSALAFTPGLYSDMLITCAARPGAGVRDSVPERVSVHTPTQLGMGEHRSRAQAFPAPVERAGRAGVQAVEGIVPGLDFCNHDTASAVRWTIWGGQKSKARL